MRCPGIVVLVLENLVVNVLSIHIKRPTRETGKGHGQPSPLRPEGGQSIQPVKQPEQPANTVSMLHMSCIIHYANMSCNVWTELKSTVNDTWNLSRTATCDLLGNDYSEMLNLCGIFPANNDDRRYTCTPHSISHVQWLLNWLKEITWHTLVCSLDR